MTVVMVEEEERENVMEIVCYSYGSLMAVTSRLKPPSPDHHRREQLVCQARLIQDRR